MKYNFPVGQKENALNSSAKQKQKQKQKRHKKHKKKQRNPKPKYSLFYVENFSLASISICILF